MTSGNIYPNQFCRGSRHRGESVPAAAHCLDTDREMARFMRRRQTRLRREDKDVDLYEGRG